MFGYSLTSLAQADVDGICLHLAKYNLPAAEGLYRFFDEKFFMLAQAPELGRIRPEFWDKARCFVIRKGTARSRYLVFYYESQNGVIIARVIEAHRRISPQLLTGSKNSDEEN